METTEEMKLRMEKYYAELNVAPEVEIIGVLIRGAGGGISRGEELWTMTFELAAWRRGSGEIQTRPLLIRQRMTRDELNKLSNRIKGYGVVTFRARIVFNEHLRQFDGLLSSPVSFISSDAELNTIAQQLQIPTVLDLQIPKVSALGHNRYSWEGSACLETWKEFYIKKNPYNDQAEYSDGNIGLYIEDPLDKEILTLDDRTPALSLGQTSALHYLVENEDKVTEAVRQAIYEQYILWRLIWDVDEPEAMPEIKSPNEIQQLIRLSYIVVSRKEKNANAYLGFQFKCAWDPEHEFGVAVHENRVVLVKEIDCLGGVNEDMKN